MVRTNRQGIRLPRASFFLGRTQTDPSRGVPSWSSSRMFMRLRWKRQVPRRGGPPGVDEPARRLTVDAAQPPAPRSRPAQKLVSPKRRPGDI